MSKTGRPFFYYVVSQLKTGTTIVLLPPIAHPIDYFLHCIYYIL